MFLCSPHFPNTSSPSHHWLCMESCNFSAKISRICRWLFQVASPCPGKAGCQGHMVLGCLGLGWMNNHPPWLMGSHPYPTIAYKPRVWNGGLQVYLYRMDLIGLYIKWNPVFLHSEYARKCCAFMFWKWQKMILGIKRIWFIYIYIIFHGTGCILRVSSKSIIQRHLGMI